MTSRDPAPAPAHHIAADGPPPPTPVGVLLRGRFGWFFAARTIDLFGNSMTTVALALAVLGASGSATDLGVVLAANMVPMLVLLLVGGALADRRSRRALLVIGNLVSATTTGLMAAMLVAGRFHLGALVVLSLITGAATAFTSPALRGIVPELVEDHDLGRANALLASTRNAVRILAPTAAGLLVAGAGGGWALGVDALTSLVSAALFLRLPRSERIPPAGGASAAGIWADLREGWTVFRSMHWVVLLTCSFALLNAVNVGPWNVLGPLLVSQDSGPGAWGAVLSVRAVGLLLASVLAVHLVLKHPLRTGRIVGALAGLPLIVLGISGNPWLVGAAAFVGGIGFTISAVTAETAFQRHVPRASLSRVSSWDDLFSYLMIPVSQLAVGPLVAHVGAGPLAIACGVGYIAASLIPLLSKQIRTQT